MKTANIARLWLLPFHEQLTMYYSSQTWERWSKIQAINEQGIEIIEMKKEKFGPIVVHKLFLQRS